MATIIATTSASTIVHCTCNFSRARAHTFSRTNLPMLSRRIPMSSPSSPAPFDGDDTGGDYPSPPTSSSSLSSLSCGRAASAAAAAATANSRVLALEFVEQCHALLHVYSTFVQRTPRISAQCTARLTDVVTRVASYNAVICTWLRETEQQPSPDCAWARELHRRITSHQHGGLYDFFTCVIDGDDVVVDGPTGALFEGTEENTAAQTTPTTTATTTHTQAVADTKWHTLCMSVTLGQALGIITDDATRNAAVHAMMHEQAAVLERLAQQQQQQQRQRRHNA